MIWDLLGMLAIGSPGLAALVIMWRQAKHPDLDQIVQDEIDDRTPLE